MICQLRVTLSPFRGITDGHCYLKHRVAFDVSSQISRPKTSSNLYCSSGESFSLTIPSMISRELLDLFKEGGSAYVAEAEVKRCL